jgi:HKD family nuclease
MIRIISNEAQRNHRQLLQSWLDGSHDGFVAVAFLKHSGLRSIKAHLEAFLQRGGTLRLMVGTDFFLTEAQALRELERLAKLYPKLEWRLVEQSSNSTFHPKYCRFQDAANVWLMTGSANLTGGGLESNIEVSVISEDLTSGPLVRETSKIENVLWNNPRAVDPTEERIGRYAAQSEMARKRMKAAEAELQRELEELPKLEGQQLAKELEAYRASAKEQADLAKRKANYQTALDLIQSELLNVAEPTQQQFEAVYQRLVGQSGGDKLWHSGSVNRGKTTVLLQWQKVVAMVRDIAANLERSPEEMYALGLKRIEQIEEVGPNIFTEFCHTLAPARYTPLNDNPVTSLRWLKVDEFPRPSAFKADDYGRFCRCLDRLKTRCGFADFGETDHFLNFVYWPIRNKAKRAGAIDEDAGASDELRVPAAEVLNS